MLSNDRLAMALLSKTCWKFCMFLNYHCLSFSAQVQTLVVHDFGSGLYNLALCLMQNLALELFSVK
jgi:hypothetical protein